MPFAYRGAKFVFYMCLAQLLLPNMSLADSLSFPLDGYFHPGRAMPVRWQMSQTPDSANANSAFSLRANGAVDVSVLASPRSHGVFPWPTIDRQISAVQCSGKMNFPITAELRPLEDAQRLVATTLADNSLASALFSNDAIVLIQLQGNTPIEGPALAWQTLDAVITSPEAFSAIPRQTRENLYLAGVVLAVEGDWPADDSLPHRRLGKLNAAQLEAGLPPLVSPAAYAPIEGWTPGRSAEYRRHIFLLGTIYLLLFFACLLMPGRGKIYVILPMTAILCLVFAWDNSNQSPVARVEGTVYLQEHAADIEDKWDYYTTPSQALLQISAHGFSEPVLFDRAQAGRLNINLRCDSEGNPDFLSVRLAAKDVLAICSREFSTSMGEPYAPADSPLRLLAASGIYPQFLVAGQKKEPPQTGRFPPIILKRAGD